jgi:hypothetical protein
MQSPQPISLNRWHLAVIVVDVSGSQLYLDGSLAGSARIAEPTVEDDHSPLAIGRSLEADRDEPFTGAVDEIAIFVRALSAKEVCSLYESGRNE